MARATFGRQARLTSRRDFDRVFSHPISKGNRYFRILARRNELPMARLGMVVSRKVDRRAVGRNAIKRLIRERFRHRQDELAGWDLVVLASPRAGGAPPAELATALDDCWNRILHHACRTRSGERRCMDG